MVSMSELLGRAHANGIAIAALAELIALQTGKAAAVDAIQDWLIRLAPAALAGAKESGNAELERGLREQMEFILGCIHQHGAPPPA
jgi:hypothetical protein